MKTVIACFAFLFTLGACQSGSKIVQSGESSNRFSQYQNLGDALRNFGGLYVTGTGVQRTVQMTRNGMADSSPLFILNGFPMGKNYQRANNAVNMNTVRSIRVVRSLSEMSQYGISGESGLIVIETNVHGSDQQAEKAPTVVQVGSRSK